VSSETAHWRALTTTVITVVAAVASLFLTPLTHRFRSLGYDWFLQHRSASLTPLFDRLTLIGDPPWFLPVAIGVGAGIAVATRRLLPILLPAVAVPLCRWLQLLDSRLFHSGAPPQVNSIGAVGGSPSGGSFRAVVLWGLAAWFVWQLIPQRRWTRAIVMAIPTIVALVEGYTRLYLGRHWPVDVVVGYVVGAVLLAGLITVDRATRSTAWSARQDRRLIPATAAFALAFLISAVLAVLLLRLSLDAASGISLASGIVATACFWLFASGLMRRRGQDSLAGRPVPAALQRK